MLFSLKWSAIAHLKYCLISKLSNFKTTTELLSIEQLTVCWKFGHGGTVIKIRSKLYFGSSTNSCGKQGCQFGGTGYWRIRSVYLCMSIFWHLNLTLSTFGQTKLKFIYNSYTTHDNWYVSPTTGSLLILIAVLPDSCRHLVTS